MVIAALEDQPRAVGGGLGEARRHGHRLVRVVGVEHVVLFDFAVWPDRRRRRRRCARPARLTMLRGLVFRYSASSGMGAWLGTPTGPQRRLIAWPLTSASRSSSMLCCARQFAQFACGLSDTEPGRRRAAPPARAPRPAIHQRRRGSPRGQARPAEHAGAAEDAQDRGREERVAGVDRQADRGERGEHDHRDHARDAPRAARGGAATAATARRRAPRRRARAGAGFRRSAGGCTRARWRSRVARPSVEAVWRVLVSDHSGSPVIAQVAEHPHQRRARRAAQAQRSHGAGVRRRAVPVAPERSQPSAAAIRYSQ